MDNKIRVYYIVENADMQKITYIETFIEKKYLHNISHKDNDYYIGFSGFDKENQPIKTIIGYDFYYFYNMVEGIMEINDIIKFENEMDIQDLLEFERNRVNEVQQQKMIITIEYNMRLKEYEKYKNDINYWIKYMGSSELNNMLLNGEEVELSYLIERVNWENKKRNINNSHEKSQAITN